jgi:poly-gamma-glutamate biosynthesis protein PgsC/CapC
MTGLAPEVSALVISLGLVLSLVCYLVTNLSPGGMITPGWLALAFIVQPLLALLIIAVVVATYLVCHWLQRVVILYGKRLFATVVLVAVFFQLTAFIFIVQKSSVFYDATTLGFIVPGLIAYQLIRQPVVATITATATVTMVAYCVMLAGILLRMVPIEGHAAAKGIAASPGAPVGSVHLVVGCLGFALILTVIAGQTRRVRSDGEALPAEIEMPRRRQPRRPWAGLGRVLFAAGHAIMLGGSVARRAISVALWMLLSPARLLAQLGRATSIGLRLALRPARSISVSAKSQRARARSAAGRIGPIITPAGSVRLGAAEDVRAERSVGRATHDRQTSVRHPVRSYVVLARRHREAVIILASVAAGFVIHFGLGRSENPAPREQPRRTLISQAATYPSVSGQGVTGSRARSKPAHRLWSDDKKLSHVKRQTRVRAANLSVTNVAGDATNPTPAPPSESTPSGDSTVAGQGTPRSQSAPAKSGPSEQQKIDDSG